MGRLGETVVSSGGGASGMFRSKRTQQPCVVVAFLCEKSLVGAGGMVLG